MNYDSSGLLTQIPSAILVVVAVIIILGIWGITGLLTNRHGWIRNKINETDRVTIGGGWLKFKLINRDPAFWNSKIGDDFLLVTRLLITLVAGIFLLEATGVEMISAITTNIGTIITGLIITPLIGAIINGLVIKRSKMFELGDVIEDRKTGQRGIVFDISMLHTKFVRFDFGRFTIPNYQIRNRDIVNYSQQNEVRRTNLDFLVTYDSDINRAQCEIEEALNECDPILTTQKAENQGLGLSLVSSNDIDKIQIGPERVGVGFNPTCRIAAFADSGVLLRAHFWIEEPVTIAALEAEIRENVRNRFGDNDIEFAYPHSQILFDNENNTLSVEFELFK